MPWRTSRQLLQIVSFPRKHLSWLIFRASLSWLACSRLSAALEPTIPVDQLQANAENETSSEISENPFAFNPTCSRTQQSICGVEGTYRLRKEWPCQDEPSKYVNATTVSEFQNFEFQLLKVSGGRDSLLDYDIIVKPGRRSSPSTACWRGMDEPCHTFPLQAPCNLSKHSGCILYKNLGDLGEVMVELDFMEPGLGICITSAPELTVVVREQHVHAVDAVPLRLTFDSTDYMRQGHWTNHGYEPDAAPSPKRLIAKCPKLVYLLEESFREIVRGVEHDGEYWTMLQGQGTPKAGAPPPEWKRASPARLGALYPVGYSKDEPSGAAMYATFVPLGELEHQHQPHHRKVEYDWKEMTKIVKEFAAPEIDPSWQGRVEALGTAAAECHRDFHLRLVKVESLDTFSQKAVQAAARLLDRADIMKPVKLAVNTDPALAYWPIATATMINKDLGVARNRVRRSREQDAHCTAVAAVFGPTDICSGLGTRTGAHILPGAAAGEPEMWAHSDTLMLGLSRAADFGYVLFAIAIVVGFLAIQRYYATSRLLIQRLETYISNMRAQPHRYVARDLRWQEQMKTGDMYRPRQSSGAPVANSSVQSVMGAIDL
ncbi:hypothetical protein CYMTET_54109 [Cymbomonas tetramitiformis]|uniref:Uncharacterized protein n=1 Tax=Cymbomonas tetramitiformis TaxID=36881 RepID=A0AAE0EPP4_9CHLO|nr:hypothetical protein CYMTET_54109 [Cymbomonas tetramitiformis]